MSHKSRFNTSKHLKALRKGDSEAWRALYDEQWQPLCALIRAHLAYSPNGQADSEELAQEVLGCAYVSIIHFRGEAQLETWLRTIALHAIIDALRAGQRERRLIERGTEMDGPDKVIRLRVAMDPEAFILRQDLLQRVLRELPVVLGKYRSLFVKQHLEDLSEQEVAEAEGLKRGTASGDLARARRRLREHSLRFSSLLHG